MIISNHLKADLDLYFISTVQYYLFPTSIYRYSCFFSMSSIPYIQPLLTVIIIYYNSKASFTGMLLFGAN